MTKQEAIEKMMDRDFHQIPTEWVRHISEATNEPHNLPMWGTMWMVDDFVKNRLNTRRMVGSPDEIDLKAIDDKQEIKDIKTAMRDLKKESISWGGCAILENYVDEEMAGEECILDADGRPTAAFLYEIDGRYLIGVNGAGWDFCDGVWDRIYDALGLRWHDEVKEGVKA